MSNFADEKILLSLRPNKHYERGPCRVFPYINFVEMLSNKFYEFANDFQMYSIMDEYYN